jgi:hypothetical protein
MFFTISKAVKTYSLSGHSGLDPESSVFSDCSATGCPFDFAQGGEHVEPRIKSGITFRIIINSTYP